MIPLRGMLKLWKDNLENSNDAARQNTITEKESSPSGTSPNSPTLGPAGAVPRGVRTASSFAHMKPIYAASSIQDGKEKESEHAAKRMKLLQAPAVVQEGQ
jgi:hypothetical protein